MAKYKVGDYVKIKSAYDPGKSSRDYPFIFTEYMLETFGGSVFRITNIKHIGIFTKYILEGNSFIWSEPMFDPVTDEL